MLEGFSFLAARVQLKLDAQFPLFTQHLLEMVYPHYLAPTPSMAVVRIEPTLSEGALAEGFTIERDTPLRTILGKGQRTPCEYRTSQDVTLWPLEIQDVEYFTHALDVPGIRDVKAGFRLRLKATAGLKFDALALDRLQLYLHGADELPMRLYRHMLADAVAVVAQPVGQPPEWREVLDAGAVRSLGFDEEQALLPGGPRSFEGYRLLHAISCGHPRPTTHPRRSCPVPSASRRVQRRGVGRAMTRSVRGRMRSERGRGVSKRVRARPPSDKAAAPRSRSPRQA